MKINDEIIVNIEKITPTGEGLARFGENKFVIFIKNALPNEKIKTKIISVNKHFAKGKIIEIIEPSSKRIKPFCPLYNACGSCQLQICDYNYSIQLKEEILYDIFKNEQNLIKPLIKSPKTLSYRHKIQFPARETKNSKRVILGYFKQNSHDITNIKFCPIQPEIINKLAQFIRENYKLGCYNEKTNKGLLKNIIARVSSSDNSILLTLVLNTNSTKFKNIHKEINNFSCKIIKEFKEVKGIFVNFNDKNTNTILGKETIKITGEDFILQKLDDKVFKIGAVSFFQINPYATENLFKLIKENIKENSTILDAYAGVGAIGIFSNNNAKKIIYVEENENAAQMAKENYKLNKIKNYEIYCDDAKKCFKIFKEQNKIFDYTILDPPRSGCEKEGLEDIANISKNIIYVSCNPITLIRDMKILKTFNFLPEFIQGIDLFPYTHHIETVILFKKEQENEKY